MYFLIAVKYLKYLLISRHRKGHGIHSPFVFDLVTRVFRNKINAGVVLIIEGIRKNGFSDNRTIRIKDLGSGSVRMNSSLRKVSDITRYSSLPAKYCALLANLASEFGEHEIVELGTAAGISTMYMAASSPQAIVYTIEGCPAVGRIASENFIKAGISNIRLLGGSFDDLLPELVKKNIKPGLIFIDGHHRREPLLRYFDRIIEMAGEKSVIIIDDIHISDEMEEAWNEIKRKERVTLTVDIFRMGLVFLREGMTHFDYVIRY